VGVGVGTGATYTGFTVSLILYFNKPEKKYIDISKKNRIEKTGSEPKNDEILRSSFHSNSILFFGSSELSGDLEMLPNKFLNTYSNFDVVSIGSAGNQCFSIYCQLLANRDLLKNQKLVIMLSPTWFEGKPALAGTSSHVFNENISENYLNNILTRNDEFSLYTCNRILEFYKDYNSPNVAIRLANYYGISQKSIIHKIIFLPALITAKFIIRLKAFFFNSATFVVNKTIRKKNASEFNESKFSELSNLYLSQKIKNSNNNNWHINNSYFSDYINYSHGNLKMLQINRNKELSDFKMLVNLIEYYNCNAIFVLMPLNSFYYSNTQEFIPLINNIKQEIASNHNSSISKFLDLYEVYSKNNSYALLDDVMHLSNYGWLYTNNFVLTNFKK